MPPARRSGDDGLTLEQRIAGGGQMLSDALIRLLGGGEHDRRGTTGPSPGGGMHYDADYVGRDYENDPVVPPAPRGS
jgi:hypothetical protein